MLGKPDTGGQIVYILDQVHALEKEMLKRIDEAGLDIEPGMVITSCSDASSLLDHLANTTHMQLLPPCDKKFVHHEVLLHADIIIVTRLIPEAQGTTCDQRIERINDTKHCYILRVPFRDGE